ncbi:hypothetical protein ACQEV4_06840 [Streptomyces shenzhenensis]|uniref:hypothetical protein n=1 Tax=Streptomyces shenzhenensis TaxID=943815 RepID=UPI003D8A8CC6
MQDPAELVSRDGLLRTRIVVERRKVDVAGRKLWALTYNGRYMPRPCGSVRATRWNSTS